MAGIDNRFGALPLRDFMSRGKTSSSTCVLCPGERIPGLSYCRACKATKDRERRARRK
jgi:hypothetical protein